MSRRERGDQVWWACCIVILSLAVACTGRDSKGADPEPPGDRPAPALIEAVPNQGEIRWHHTISPSADLKTMAVRVCFPGRLPTRFDAQMPAARWSLIEAKRHPGGQTLKQEVSGLDLSPLSVGDCIDYTVDLDQAAARAKSNRRIRRIDDDWYISPDYWLWQPYGREQVMLTARVQAPAGVTMSVPWPMLDTTTYHIPDSTFLWQAPGTLGHHRLEVIQVAESRVHLAILGGSWTAPRTRLISWITAAAHATARLGGFPRTDVQAILLPYPGEGVGFGFATQGGGGSIVVRVGNAFSEDQVTGDWVGVHELLHLGMPMLDDPSAWLSEGLSTYYEPLLRARSGMLSERAVWELMHEGFSRGARRPSPQSLRQDSATMGETRRYQRVYWGGAAIAFIADVAARQVGRSLDQEILAVRACCLLASTIYSADDLMTRTDESGNPLIPHLTAAARPYIDSAEFPDVTATYRALGLSFDERGRVTMSNDARTRALREQLVGPVAVASPDP